MIFIPANRSYALFMYLHFLVLKDDSSNYTKFSCKNSSYFVCCRKEEQ